VCLSSLCSFSRSWDAWKTLGRLGALRPGERRLEALVRSASVPPVALAWSGTGSAVIDLGLSLILVLAAYTVIRRPNSRGVNPNPPRSAGLLWQRGRARGYEPHAQTNAEMVPRYCRAARRDQPHTVMAAIAATRTWAFWSNDTLRAWSVKPAGEDHTGRNRGSAACYAPGRLSKIGAGATWNRGDTLKPIADAVPSRPHT